MAIKNIEDIEWSKMTEEEIDLTLLERVRYYYDSIEKNNNKKPKREGFIVERIAMIDNLREADREAQIGKIKKNRHIRRHNMRAEEELRTLQRMILTLDFPKVKYSFMTICNSDEKVREIVKKDYFPWRILDHAIMRVIGLTLNKYMTVDTFACVKGKGLHYGVRRMKRMLRRYRKMRYFVKTDYKKFYHTIPHELIKSELAKRFKDKYFFKLLDLTIFSYSSDKNMENLIKTENDKKRCYNWSFYKSATM